MSSFIYFVGNTTRDVKIGISRDPFSRLEALQSASPTPLTLLGVMAGDRALERNMHNTFYAYRQAGEWFWLSPEIERFISTHAKDFDDVYADMSDEDFAKKIERKKAEIGILRKDQVRGSILKLYEKYIQNQKTIID